MSVLLNTSERGSYAYMNREAIQAAKDALEARNAAMANKSLADAALRARSSIIQRVEAGAVNNLGFRDPINMRDYLKAKNQANEEAAKALADRVAKEKRDEENRRNPVFISAMRESKTVEGMNWIKQYDADNAKKYGDPNLNRGPSKTPLMIEAERNDAIASKAIITEYAKSIKLANQDAKSAADLRNRALYAARLPKTASDADLAAVVRAAGLDPSTKAQIDAASLAITLDRIERDRLANLPTRAVSYDPAQMRQATINRRLDATNILRSDTNALNSEEEFKLANLQAVANLRNSSVGVEVAKSISKRNEAVSKITKPLANKKKKSKVARPGVSKLKKKR